MGSSRLYCSYAPKKGATSDEATPGRRRGTVVAVLVRSERTQEVQQVLLISRGQGRVVVDDCVGL